MLVGELIQRIQSLYSKGVQSDDSRLTSRHIYNKLVGVRSRLLSEELKVKQKLGIWNYQTLSCVELIKTPQHECVCLPPLGCMFLKTKYQLPKTFTGKDKPIIQAITTIDGNIIFSETTWLEKKYKQYNKYTSNKPDYYIKNNYLYITSNSELKIISITAVFEDPLSVYAFPSYCPSDIYDECESIFDKEFPIDSDKTDMLIEFSVQELMQLFNQNREDLTNNTIDNNGEESK